MITIIISLFFFYLSKKVFILTYKFYCLFFLVLFPVLLGGGVGVIEKKYDVLLFSRLNHKTHYFVSFHHH